MSVADPEVVIAADAAVLAEVCARAAAAPAIALDVEANGLFAYRARLCLVEMAFFEGDKLVVAVLDALATSVAPLASLLSSQGPPKVLHDLAFDARLLAQQGIELGSVRDTSVAAMLLGEPRTGLAAIVAKELERTLSKELQSHNWALRPLEPAHLEYLIDDVRYLLDLDARLSQRVRAEGIDDEVRCEVEYRLAGALAPEEPRPAFTRLRGVGELDGPGRAVARRLTMERDAIAEDLDVPPHQVLSNAAIIELAKRRPTEVSVVAKIAGRGAPRAGRFCALIAEGLADGDVPEGELAHVASAKLDRERVARQRAKELVLLKFRKAEAELRHVLDQVVMPGHCLTHLAAIAAEGEVTRAIIEAVPGFGAQRAARYADELVALLSA